MAEVRWVNCSSCSRSTQQTSCCN